MAKKSKNDRPDWADAPIYFVDQAAGMLLGHTVSRITFGIHEEDDSSEYPRPAVTIAIPTTQLLDLVSDLKMILDNDQFKADMSKRLENSIKKINAGVKSTPSDYVKEMLMIEGEEIDAPPQISRPRRKTK